MGHEQRLFADGERWGWPSVANACSRSVAWHRRRAWRSAVPL